MTEVGAFMRTDFLCFSVLRVASGPRVKSASCKSVLTPTSPRTPPPPPPHDTHTPAFYSTDRSKAVAPVSLTLCCFVIYSMRRFVLCLTLCYLFLCFSVLLALRLPRLGKRELILALFVRLFDLRLFGFVCFLFLLESGKGCGLWLWHSLDFSLTFLFCYMLTMLIL